MASTSEGGVGAGISAGATVTAGFVATGLARGLRRGDCAETNNAKAMMHAKTAAATLNRFIEMILSMCLRFRGKYLPISEMILASPLRTQISASRCLRVLKTKEALNSV